MEGAPDWPADRIWSLVDEERVTMLGISPTLVRALIPHGDPTADLSSLRTVTTTGEPWNRGPYDWLDKHVCGGGRIPIVNVLGRHRGGRVLPRGLAARSDQTGARSASPRSASTWTSSTTTGSRCAAPSASLSASDRGLG
jgi:hypothetical protein